MNITFIGSGALASGMARALHSHGFTIDEFVFHSERSTARAKALAKAVNGRAVSFAKASLEADVIWIAVSDAAIEDTANTLAKAQSTDWRAKVVLHSSAALASDRLRALKALGASIASLHPMMTFPRSPKESAKTPDLTGVFLAFEASAKDRRATRVCRKIVSAIGGELFSLRAEDKALYHAFGAFLSPLMISHMAAAAEVAVKAGVKPAQAHRIMRPIVERTLENFYQHGANEALSGPLVRGDVETIRKHLDALSQSPNELALYRALSLYAVQSLETARPDEIRTLLENPKRGLRANPKKSR